MAHMPTGPRCARIVASRNPYVKLCLGLGGWNGMLVARPLLQVNISTRIHMPIPRLTHTIKYRCLRCTNERSMSLHSMFFFLLQVVGSFFTPFSRIFQLAVRVTIARPARGPSVLNRAALVCRHVRRMPRSAANRPVRCAFARIGNVPFGKQVQRPAAAVAMASSLVVSI